MLVTATAAGAFAPPLLDVRGVTLQRSDRFILLGPSGCGKLLRLLARQLGDRTLPGCYPSSCRSAGTLDAGSLERVRLGSHGELGLLPWAFHTSAA